MATLDAVKIIDQRKYQSHVLVLLLCLLIVLVVSFMSETTETLKDMLRFFIFLFVQIEVFIFIAFRIFTEISIGLTPVEFTRIILKRFLLFIIICFIVALLLFISFRYLVALAERSDLPMVWRNIMKYEFKGWFSSTLKGLSVGAVIFVLIQWQDSLKREQKLREENLIFQNETLKSQVNPHFLFNSLNTLSALIKPDPDTAETFINRLASIYRYILENNSADHVPLEKEIAFIKDYFYLHSVRDENKIVLEINVGQIDDYRILPVSLQVLVENAIKHNMATRGNPLRITVFLEEGYIVVRNNLQKINLSMKSTGTGLKNLSDRVRIITSKSIIINETTDSYSVKLPLIR
ncbi:MAG TPA: histidine kinase [Bacteroidales bacterium]|nr:histidine kinase [Bacteroidales bacterium]